MAKIRSFPNNQDEYIGAEDVMRWLHGRTSGVFGIVNNAGAFPVAGEMAVGVTDGKGWLSNDKGDGIVWWIDNKAKTGVELKLTVDIADAYLPRIDRVVVSWDTTNYVALPEIIILKGTPASNPVPPALTNNSMVRQISLAGIEIPAGATSLNEAMVYDERLNPDVCGIVTENVSVDTSALERQIAFFMDDSRRQLDDFISENTQKWDAFYANVQKDTIVPVPGPSDKGKAVIVNEDGNGYTLGDAQLEIPITSEVPEDADIWIDPSEPSGAVELGFDSGELPNSTQFYDFPNNTAKFATVTIFNAQGPTYTALVDCTVEGGAEYDLPVGFGGCLFVSRSDGQIRVNLEDGVDSGVYISRVCGYGYVGGESIGASTYYHTTRESSWGEADVDDNGNLPTKYVWDLYDALMAKYDNVKKNPIEVRDETGEVIFTNYEYVISTGDYSTDAAYVQHYGNNPPIKKPKYLILSGIHGRERKAVFSTYRFFRDLLSGHNIPTAFREGAIFSVIPVGTPNSFDLFIRNNAPTVYDEAGNVVSEGVNINRNFNAENPEKETQAIMNWLNANADANLFVDVHNNGALNEKVLIISLPNNSISNTARKTALRGVDNIIPYWRDVIGYPDKVEAEGLDGTITNRAVIYSYTATINTDGLSIKYAQNVVGIPSITIELASFYGSTTEWLDGTWKDGKLVPGENAKKADSPEAVAMGAEALGNILLEFYKQEDMLLPESGTHIYNGEALLNVNPDTQNQFYTGEVE